MEPRPHGGSSSLHQRHRNPPVSSSRVASCGRSARRRPGNSLGGRVGGPDPLANPPAESFPTPRARFFRSRRNLLRLNLKVAKGGSSGRTAPDWSARSLSKRCACCRLETRFWRPQTGRSSSRRFDFGPSCGPSPCGRVRSWSTVSSWEPGVGNWAESRCGPGDRWEPTSKKRSRRRSPAFPLNRRGRRSVGRRAMRPFELRDGPSSS